MKKIKKSLVLICSLAIMLTTLSGCGMPKRSDVKGEWKAVDIRGNKDTIKFTDDYLILNGEKNKIKFTSSGFKNDIKYLGFEYKNKTYSILLVDKDNEDTAVILEVEDEENMLKGIVLWVMNRDKYLNYDEVVKSLGGK